MIDLWFVPVDLKESPETANVSAESKGIGVGKGSNKRDIFCLEYTHMQQVPRWRIRVPRNAGTAFKRHVWSAEETLPVQWCTI